MLLMVIMPLWVTRHFGGNYAAEPALGDRHAEGFMLGYRECLPADDDERIGEVRSDQSVVTWEYDGEGNLDLHHLNSAFNCCPELECEVSVDSNVITIREAESGDCDCVCLYDVDYRVKVPTGRSYLVRFEELYLDEDDETIEFYVTLGGQPRSGTFVAYRGHHPWESDGSVWGKLLNLAEIRRLPEIRTRNLPDRGNCIIWDYDNDILRLRHRGAVFNYGIGVVADITLKDRVITVREYTQGITIVPAFGPRNLEMKVYNLPEAEYRLEILHPRESFETILDLPYVPRDHFCPGY